MLRQGDILLIPTTPVTGMPVSAEGIRVEGERTGHVHELAGTVYPAQTGLGIIHVGTDGAMVHPEHGVMEVPSGWYEVRQQREWTGGPRRTGRRWD